MKRAEVAESMSADFGEFFEEHYRRLFHAMVLICGQKSEADDVAQGAFVCVLERWDRVKLMEDPVAYLFTVALNEQRSRSRRARRWAQRSLFTRQEPDGVSAVAIARADIGRALARLTEDQRTAVVLVDFAGLRSAEAADVLGIEPDAVRARLHRARTTLREGWNDDE
jgi:RNA polymerase sigma-70 factor (ECF subfamily)